MAKNKIKEEYIEGEKMDATKNMLNSLLEGYKEDHYNHIQNETVKISSGSLVLDSLISVKSGDIIRLCSNSPEAGKTSQSFLFAKNYMEAMSPAKTLYIKSESRLSDELKLRTGLKFTEKSEDWDINSVFVLNCNIFETVAQIVESLLKITHENGIHLAIILDSLDGMILKNDYKKDIGGSEGGIKVGGVPLLSKLLFRKIALPINKYNALFMACSQYSASININPYAKDPPKMVEASGGNNISFQANYILNYASRYQSDLILEKPDEKPDMTKNKILGHYATVEIKKSSMDTSGYRARIAIRKGKVGNAIWVSKEVVDIMLGWSLILKKGAWFSFEDSVMKEAKESGLELKEQVQGLNNLYDYFEDNKQVFDFFFIKAKNLING